jgi:phasin
MLATTEKTLQRIKDMARNMDPGKFTEQAAAQSKENLDKLSTAAQDATNLVKDTYAAGVKGAQDYNAKLIEFARINTEAAFAYAQQLSSVKSPAEFVELTTKYAREQFEAMTEQTRELAALAQKMTLGAADPLKSRASKAFS